MGTGNMYAVAFSREAKINKTKSASVDHCNRNWLFLGRLTSWAPLKM